MQSCRAKMLPALVFILFGSCLPALAEVPATEVGSQQDFLVGLAENGEIAAQLLLAETLLVSAGPADMKAAFRWFRRAAEAGNAEAQRRLAQLYERGLGTNVDRNAALSWYRLAADQGDLPARCRMALEEMQTSRVP